MITMIEVVEGYEPYFECWSSSNKYLGDVHKEELDLFIKGITDSGGTFEIVSSS